MGISIKNKSRDWRERRGKEREEYVNIIRRPRVSSFQKYFPVASAVTLTSFIAARAKESKRKGKKKNKTKPINVQSALIARLIFDLHRVATRRHPRPVSLFIPPPLFVRVIQPRLVDRHGGFCVTAAGWFPFN